MYVSRREMSHHSAPPARRCPLHAPHRLAARTPGVGWPGVGCRGSKATQHTTSSTTAPLESHGSSHRTPAAPPPHSCVRARARARVGLGLGLPHGITATGRRQPHCRTPAEPSRRWSHRSNRAPAPATGVGQGRPVPSGARATTCTDPYIYIYACRRPKPNPRTHAEPKPSLT
jgi:hypothetical protein